MRRAAMAVDQRVIAPWSMYRRMFAESADGIAVIDENGQYVEQNKAHEELTGYSDADLRGQTPAIHLGQAAFERICDALAREGRFHGEVPSRNKSGDLKVLDLTAFSVRDDETGRVMFVGIKRDITDRKIVEAERIAQSRLLEQVYALTTALNHAAKVEDVYEAAINAVLAATGADRASVLIFDDAGVMRFVAWRGLSEKYRGAVEGHCPWARDERNPQPICVEDVCEDAACAALLPLFLEEGIRALAFIPIAYEGRLLGKFMIYYDAAHTFSEPVVRAASAMASPVAVAIQRQKSDEALRRSERLATAGRLAATIAHEINNPLEAVMNLVYLLRSTTDESTRDRFLADVDSELRRLSQITRQTLAFYRDVSQPRSVNVASVVQDLVGLYSSKLKQKDVTVELNLEQAMAHIVAGELQQVIANLLANAIDAVSSGGCVAVRVGEQDGYVELTISDNGSGIPEELLPRIFEPFFTTKKEAGTGLGLWVTKQLAEKNGGSLTVKTSTLEEGHGTAFTIRIPVETERSTI